MSRTFSMKNGSLDSLEVLLPVRLHPEHPEPALHSALGNSSVLGHGTHAPPGVVGPLGM